MQFARCCDRLGGSARWRNAGLGKNICAVHENFRRRHDWHAKLFAPETRACKCIGIDIVDVDFRLIHERCEGQKPALHGHFTKPRQITSDDVIL